MSRPETNVETPLQLASYNEQMEAHRQKFLSQWEPANRHLPESKGKAMKLLRDWRAFMKEAR